MQRGTHSNCNLDFLVHGADSCTIRFGMQLLPARTFILGMQWDALSRCYNKAMTRTLIATLAVALTLGCATAAPAQQAPAAAQAPRITIASFNVQIFGKTKSSKPKILAQLAAIIRKYDVVAVQEVKDKSGKAPVRLLHAINVISGPRYGMLLSERGGRQPDDKRSQEQYAIFYRQDTITALPGDHLYDDSASDQFQREPYLVHLKVKGQPLDFVLISIHTRPDSAVEEIAALHDVVRSVDKAFPGEQDVIVLGDFNAGCSYARPAQLDALAIRGPEYTWVVPDSADTNLAKSSCAYDRIVTHGSVGYAGQWGVDKAFTDKRVSDHWPVWLELTIDR